MNFGSNFVYFYSDSEEEIVSDYELEVGLQREYSSSDESAEAEALIPTALPGSAPKADKKGASGMFGGVMKRLQESFKGRKPNSEPALSSASKPKKHRRRRSRSRERKDYEFRGTTRPSSGRAWRRADTNVITIKFDELTSPKHMHTGDPVYCKSCSAVLSKISKLTTREDGDQVWMCEFCGGKNEVDLVQEEMPASEDLTYMLEPATSIMTSSVFGGDQSLVVFCVDVSGSMCVTTEVPGRMNLRGSHLDRIQSLNETRESQHIPGQNRNVTFVSRLQAVQAAVDHQLTELAKEHPNRRCCLVTFNNEVTVVGDAIMEPVCLVGEKLYRKDELIQAASDLPKLSAVKDCQNKLSEKLFDLEEMGMTALGPALLFSVSLASKAAGSKVIICTDGLANVGLGNLDDLNSDTVYAENASFYTDVCNMAVDAGVCVSVTTIAGTQCRLVELGKVAEATGGQVNIVDPLKLTQEFGSILADPIIATNVSATLKIHRGLYLREGKTKDATTSIKYIGNVTKSTEISFEYGVRETERTKSKPTLLGPVPMDDETSESQKDDAAKSKPPASDIDSANPVRVETPSNEAESSTAPENPVRSAAEAQVASTEGNTGEAKPGPSSDLGVTASDARAKEKGQDVPKEFPFQLQIIYKDIEGTKAMRVITNVKPVTRDRATADRYMNMPVLGVHAAKQSAHMALEGEYMGSRMNGFMYKRLLKHGVKRPEARDTSKLVYQNFCRRASEVDSTISSRQRAELRERGRTYSDSDSSDEEVYDAHYSAPTGGAAFAVKAKACLVMPKTSAAAIGKKGLRRRMEMQDDGACDLYDYAQLTSRDLTSEHSTK